jgi:hypothetical protein
VVTETGLHRAGGADLVRLTPEECVAEVGMLMKARDLPRPRMAEPRETGDYASPVCYAPEIAPDYFGATDKGSGNRD